MPLLRAPYCPLSQRPSRWPQEGFKARRILAPGGIAFAASQFVFAGYSGEPFSNRAFNLQLRAACRALGVGEITAHGLRRSAATILLNQVGKDLREIQEPRDENDKQRAPAARLWRRWDLGLLRPCDGPEGMSCSAGAGVGCSESIGD